eukprot:UC4_evm1s385
MSKLNRHNSMGTNHNHYPKRMRRTSSAGISRSISTPTLSVGLSSSMNSPLSTHSHTPSDHHNQQPQQVASSKMVAMDLILRNLMSNPSVLNAHGRNAEPPWDKISSLIPNSTPLEVARRWGEIQVLNRPLSAVRELSSLAARGRPFSAHAASSASSGNKEPGINTTNTTTSSSNKLSRFMRHILQQKDTAESGVVLDNHMTRLSSSPSRPSSRHGIRPPSRGGDNSRPSSRDSSRGVHQYRERPSSRGGDNTGPSSRDPSRGVNQRLSSHAVDNIRPTSRDSSRVAHQHREHISSTRLQRHLSSDPDGILTATALLDKGKVDDGISLQNTQVLNHKGKERTNSSDASGIESRTRSQSGSGSSSACGTGIRGKSVEGSHSIPTSRGEVIIHVFDNSRNIQRDFVCQRDILIKEMKYFVQYLSDSDMVEGIDISVHCDVNIFDWLIRYVKAKSTGNSTPKLEIRSIVSILISSEFLMMDTLVEECLEFCHAHMTEIIKSPCDMNCISDNLLTRLTNKFTHSELGKIPYANNSFIESLYWKKIESLVSCFEHEKTLFKCRYCHKHLILENHEQVSCTNARMRVDKSGALLYRHMPDRNWSLNQYIRELKEKGKTTKEIFWHLWGIVHYLTCDETGCLFRCCDINSKRYHPEAPLFGEGNTTTGALGVYPCCEEPVLRFDPMSPQKGCMVKSYRPKLETEEEKFLYKQVVENMEYVAIIPENIEDIDDLNTSFDVNWDLSNINPFGDEELAVGIVPFEEDQILDEHTAESEQYKKRALRSTSRTRLRLKSRSFIGVGEDEDADTSDWDLVSKVQMKPRPPRRSQKKKQYLRGADDFDQIRAQNFEMVLSEPLIHTEHREWTAGMIKKMNERKSRDATWDQSQSKRQNLDRQRLIDLARMSNMMELLRNMRSNIESASELEGISGISNSGKKQSSQKSTSSNPFSKVVMRENAITVAAQAKEKERIALEKKRTSRYL